MNNIMPKKALIAVLCVVAVLGVFVILAISAGNAETISEADAKTAALQHADVAEKDTDYMKIERDTDDGKAKYDIDFSADGYEYDYEVDAKSGAILKSEKELKEKNTGDVAGRESEMSVIDENTAKKAALDHAGLTENNVRFTTVHIDDDGQYYEIEFISDGYKYEYEIEILRGTVLESKKEEIKTN